MALCGSGFVVPSTVFNNNMVVSYIGGGNQNTGENH